MSSVVVIGAQGTLGARLCRHLGAEGIEPPRQGDLSAADREAIATADVIINAAGPRVRAGLAWNDYFDHHVGTAAKVARLSRPGAHVIHLGSTAVYGARGTRLDAETPESPLLFPNPSYACAKLAAEMAVRGLCRERGVWVTVLRLSMVYGPSVESALGTILAASRQGIELRLLPATMRQHLLHVDLLLRAIEALVKRPRGTISPPLLLADPFVVTNAELSSVIRARRRTVSVPVPLNAVKGALGRWPWYPEREAPGPLAALAVLGLDNEFDWRPAFEALGLDVAEFDRARTFDRYIAEAAA